MNLKTEVGSLKKKDVSYEVMIDVISNIVKNYIDNKLGSSDKKDNIK